MAPLKPTFLWRRIGTRRHKAFRSVAALERSYSLRDAVNYATIFVKPAAQINSRATPPHRQNHLDVALLTSDRVSETGDYNERAIKCQVSDRVYGVYRGGRFHRDETFARMQTLSATKAPK